MCKRRCCGKIKTRVLIWLLNTLGGGATFTTLVNTYRAMGATVDSVTVPDVGWTGDINDYGLIHWYSAISDPTWWPLIVAKSWKGRLHITCDGDVPAVPGLIPPTVNYVNGIRTVTGISATLATLDSAGASSATIADPLTAGQDTLYHVNASQLSGGNVLSRTVGGGSLPWLCRNVVSGTDFIVSGDAAYMIDGFIDFATPSNLRYFKNMLTVRTCDCSR